MGDRQGTGEQSQKAGACMKSFRLGPLAIDPAAYGSHGNAILGIRDSGKSYTATLLAEHLFDAGIPFIAFDPIGIWRYLRVPGRGKGYPIVVAGGKEGDLPLTVGGASTIVRAAMQGGVSLVIDLFDVNLSKADWRRIVTAAVRTLLHENQPHGLRHVFIEEAAEFIPQRPTDWDVYAEIEKLARMGGNARLGYTLINQRSQEVSKAILELCENVFLHRQRGKNALENMDKWLSIVGAAEQKEIIRTLPDMPQGECWAWLGGDEPQPPTRIKVPPKNSFHPDRRVVRGDAVTTKAKPVDVGQFVAGMKGQLEKIVEEAKANDPKALRAEIARLKTELAKKPASEVDPGAIDAAHQQGFREGLAARATNEREFVERVREAGRRVGEAYAAASKGFQEALEAAVKASAAAPPPVRAPGIVHRQTPFVAAPALRATPARQPAAPSDGTMVRGERAILTVLAQFAPQALDKARLGAIAGFASKGGSFRTYVGRLKTLGYVDRDALRITQAGLDALGEFEPLPTGRALLDHWCAKLVKGEREILLAVATNGGEASRDEIGAATGFEPSGGSFRTYVGKLKTLGLLTGSNPLILHQDLQ